MAATLTANEEAQLLQTIEMFEVITQSQPYDYQSLEILKEAYSKLGRHKDVVSTSKRIAEAYVQLGQLSSAILEYESILQVYPDDPDVQKALAEIANKAADLAAPAMTLETFPSEKGATVLKARVDGKAPPADVDDGRQMFQRILVDGKLVSVGDFNLYWPQANFKEPVRQAAEPFILTLSEKGVLPLDQSLKLICDKSRLGYLPIEKYDVDVELARTFPRELCLRWCMLPFDRMSKSVLVATANPFNRHAMREMETHTKNRLLWYMTSPQELLKVLRKILR